MADQSMQELRAGDLPELVIRAREVERAELDLETLLAHLEGDRQVPDPAIRWAAEADVADARRRCKQARRLLHKSMGFDVEAEVPTPFHIPFAKPEGERC